MAGLRGRRTQFETTEKLEVLRQKKEEVQAKELEFKKEYEKRLKELTAREQELEQKEVDFLKVLVPIFGHRKQKRCGSKRSRLESYALTIKFSNKQRCGFWHLRIAEAND